MTYTAVRHQIVVRVWVADVTEAVLIGILLAGVWHEHAVVLRETNTNYFSCPTKSGGKAENASSYEIREPFCSG